MTSPNAGAQTRAARVTYALALSLLVISAVVQPARAQNVQEGDNAAEVTQEGSAASGDAISGGQVIAVASSGNVSINATNTAENTDAETGDVSGLNNMSGTVGQVSSGEEVQEEAAELSQETFASSPVIGAELSAAFPASASAPDPSGPGGPVGPPMVLEVEQTNAAPSPRAGFSNLGPYAADLVGPLGPVGP